MHKYYTINSFNKSKVILISPVNRRSISTNVIESDIMIEAALHQAQLERLYHVCIQIFIRRDFK